MKYLFCILLLVACGKVPDVKIPVTETEKPKESEPTSTETPKVTEPSPVPVVPESVPVVVVDEEPEEEVEEPELITGCEMLPTGFQTKTYTNTHKNKTYSVNMSGRIFCRYEDPDLYELFSWQIDNYCNIIQYATVCTISVVQVYEVSGYWNAEIQINNSRFSVPLMHQEIQRTAYWR